LLVAGGAVISDGVQSFGETASRDGAIGHIRGPQIMPELVRLALG
jgi:2,3-bisphosphoglycerate-independent phosphoglycerate mutase